MAIKIQSLEQISRIIRENRGSLGISQKRLAKMCGLSQSTIARIETDVAKLNPSYQSVFYVVEALNRSEGMTGKGIMSKAAREIMHRRIISVKPSSPIIDAIDIFKDYDFPQLPVLDNSRHVVGTIYQKDLLSMATQSPDIMRRRNVGSIMKAPLPQVGKDSEVTGLRPILESAGAVMVVEEGKAIGIITIYDILKTF